MLPSFTKSLAVFILFIASIHSDPAGFNVLACLLLLAAVDAGTGVETNGDWSAQIMLWAGRFFSWPVLPFYLLVICTALVLPAQQKTMDPSKAVQVPVRKTPVPTAAQAAVSPSRPISPGARLPGQRPPPQTLQPGTPPRLGSPQRPLTSRPGAPAPGTPVKPAPRAAPAPPQAPKSAPAAASAPSAPAPAGN